MMRRKLVGRAVLAGALLLGAGAGTVATALPASAAATTIKLTDQNKPSDVVFVDNGVPGPSPGDQLIFHSNLNCIDNCGTPGTRVGTLDVTCTILVRNNQNCTGTARFFGQGKITFAGVFAGNKSSFIFAITGGTGTYFGASGQIYVNTRPATGPGNGEKIVINLA